MSSVYVGSANHVVSITIPDDGDTVNASAINTPLEGLLDTTLYNYVQANTAATRITTLENQVGDYFLASMQAASGSSMFSPSLTHTATTRNISLGSLGAGSGGSGTAVSSATTAVGDIVEVALQSEFLLINPSGTAAAQSILQISQGGGGAVNVVGATTIFDFGASAASHSTAPIGGMLVCTTPGLMAFFLDVQLAISGASDTFKFAAYTCILRVWRPRL